jgi:hypothetical protein
VNEGVADGYQSTILAMSSFYIMLHIPLDLSYPMANRKLTFFHLVMIGFTDMLPFF